MRNSYQEANLSGSEAVREDGGWLMGVPAIVADNADPLKMHRIRCLIPSIDEENIYDIWIRQLVFCLGNGYGSFFIPPLGSEVVLFGQIGQKYDLFYASVYNEEHFMPPDCEDETVAGVRVPGDLKLIADCDTQVRAGRVEIEADSRVNIIAPGGVFINGRRF